MNGNETVICSDCVFDYLRERGDLNNLLRLTYDHKFKRNKRKIKCKFCQRETMFIVSTFDLIELEAWK